MENSQKKKKKIQRLANLYEFYTNISKIKNYISLQPYRVWKSHLKERAFYSPLGRSIGVGLLGENHHKINLITGENPLLNEKCCSPFVDHFLHRLIEWIDPRLTIVIGQGWCFSKSNFASFVHCYYEWREICYFVLNAVLDELLVTMT